jgi:hypothetical protein
MSLSLKSPGKDRLRNGVVLAIVPLLACVLLSTGAVSSMGATPPRADEEKWRRHTIDNSSDGADGVRLADVNSDGLKDIVTGWEEGGITRVYQHPDHDQVKQPWPAVTVGRTPSVEDAVFADLDGDGAVDVVTSCEGSAQSVFLHWAPSRREYMDPGKWGQQVLPASKGRMRWMFAAPMQVDDQHGPDIVAAGKGEDAQLGWFKAPQDPRNPDQWQWHEIDRVGWVMSLILVDMDADGDRDVLLTDRRGTRRGCRWLENPGPGPAQELKWTNHVIGGTDREVMFMTYADIDQDGLQDALVAAKPRLILGFRRLDESGTKWEPFTIPFPANTGRAKGVAVGDMNGDGRRDVVFSCEGATPPKSGLMWMSPEGSIANAEWTAYEVSGPEGIKYDRIELLDLDGDGDLDILTCEENARDGEGLGVFWHENPGAYAASPK